MAVEVVVKLMRAADLPVHHQAWVHVVSRAHTGGISRTGEQPGVVALLDRGEREARLVVRPDTSGSLGGGPCGRVVVVGGMEVLAMHGMHGKPMWQCFF